MNLRNAAADYRAAVEEVQTNCSEAALVNLRVAEDALKAAAVAGCYDCGGPNRNCQCENDE